MPSLLISRDFPRLLSVVFTLAVAGSWGTFADTMANPPEGHAAAQRGDIADVSSASADDAIGDDSRLQPQTFGWIERVILSPELKWELDAKLDTGADTSSLDATKMRRVRYKGKSYVRFSIENPETGEMVSLRRPYVRTVRIRRHSGNHQRRRIVLMTVCLGQVERTIEVTLTDRDVFDYPMLLGRSALAGVAIVDPMAMYTAEPDCKKLSVAEHADTDTAQLPGKADVSATISGSSGSADSMKAPRTDTDPDEAGQNASPQSRRQSEDQADSDTAEATGSTSVSTQAVVSPHTRRIASEAGSKDSHVLP